MENAKCQKRNTAEIYQVLNLHLYFSRNGLVAGATLSSSPDMWTAKKTRFAVK